MPILGTAGHIDHGKTALIGALTGIDTDRLKEEKERGISIDLGFACFDLSSGERVGVIDVPGHERFLKNMLAGAHGIDLVLLVVAADDGVMPQTEEHLDIVHLLGARHGVVAITKCDLVDAARLIEVEEEVEILVSGTALEDAPVVKVSSTTGDGIAELRQILDRQMSTLSEREVKGFFRLPIDRAFALHGHGTVVTGTAISGSTRPGDHLRVLPAGREARVRTVHVHNQEVDAAHAGQRVALNLSGSDCEQIRRGDVICDRRLERVSSRFDAWIEIRPAAGIVRNHQSVRLHLGTAETMGKLILLGRDELKPREHAYAQVVVRDSLPVMYGDRFILRGESARRTLGGGVVIDPFARRHRRSQAQLIERLDQLRQADSAGGLIDALMSLDDRVAVDLDDLAQASGLLPERIQAAVAGDPRLMLLPDPRRASVCATAERWDALRARVLEHLSVYHREQPQLAGVEMESMRTTLAAELSPKVFRVLIEAMDEQRAIVREESSVRLPSHAVRVDVDVAGRIDAILDQGGFTPPDLRDIETSLSLSRKQIQPVLQQLERAGRVIKVDETIYFGARPLAEAREKLRVHVVEHGSINAAQFRDLLGASRKFSIGLLDYFDRTGFTLRVGDLRKLRR